MWLGRITLGCGIGLIVLSLVYTVMFITAPDLFSPGATGMTGLGRALLMGLIVGPGFIMYGSKKIKESSMPNIINASELLENESPDRIANFAQFVKKQAQQAEPDKFWGLTIVYVTSDWKLGIASSEPDPEKIINLLSEGQRIIAQQINAEEAVETYE